MTNQPPDDSGNVVDLDAARRQRRDEGVRTALALIERHNDPTTCQFLLGGSTAEQVLRIMGSLADIAHTFAQYVAAMNGTDVADIIGQERAALERAMAHDNDQNGSAPA